MNKITIIGAGNVGSTIAYSLIADNLFEEIALIDINKKLAACQVMDLQHSIPFWGQLKVKQGTYADIKDSQITVISCGARQKPGQTRIDLVKQNSAILKEIVPQIFKQNPKTILLIVTNPVDILTYQAIKMYPSKKNQIIGSGTLLDSARFRYLLGQELKINPRSIHAYIVGEHGDSELPLWSGATIGNLPLDKFSNLTAKDKVRIFNKAKNAAYAIIEGKQATYYAIAAGITQLVKAIIHNKQTVFSISHLWQGELGIKDVCMSSPTVIGRQGIDKILPCQVSASEKKLLKLSASQLKAIAKKIK